MLNYKSNKELLNEMDEYVYGHEKAKKALITLVNRSKYRHHQKYVQLVHKNDLVSPLKCLLVGVSGTGKTHLLHTLKDLLDFPLITLDATNLGPTGSSNSTDEKGLKQMIYAEANRLVLGNNNYHSIEGVIDQMVIFVDELDKLGVSFDSSGNWNSHTQANFLTMIDNKEELAGVSWVFSGAFMGVERKAIKNAFGFNNDKEEYTVEIDDEQIIKAGVLPELVGRISSIVALDEFNKEDYREILRTMILPKKQSELAAMGLYDLSISKEYEEEMVAKAIKSGQGIRSLIRDLNSLYMEAEFNLEVRL